MNSNTKSIFPRETIEKIIHESFGHDVEIDTITELTDGWFNAIYILSFSEKVLNQYKELVLKTGVLKGKYVLSYEKDIMQAEVFVYSFLKDTSIPIPKIIKHDFSHSLVDCDYFIMEKLQGDNWEKLEEYISPQNNEQLIAEMARHTATLHTIKGSYFGYIKEDESFQYADWRSAFQGMVNTLIGDGIKGGVDLPYQLVLAAFEPLWEILDEIKEPSLVNFDMWKKNIMLIEKDGDYVIDAIIDHERAFYGDPYAEFISSNTICGDISTNEVFQKNYSSISGREFSYTRNDKIRLFMYTIYLTLLMGVEVYRYNEEDTKNMLDDCHKMIADQLLELNTFLEGN